MTIDNGDYRDDYIKHENLNVYDKELEELIDFFSKMNITPLKL